MTAQREELPAPVVERRRDAPTVLPAQPSGSRRRLDPLGSRPPRYGAALLVLLAAAGPVLNQLPDVGLAPLAPLLFVTLLAPLWVQPALTRVLVTVSVVASAAPPLDAPVLPPPAEIAGALATLAALLALAELVQHSARRVLEAQAQTLRERAARESELQRLAAEQSELAERLEHGTTHDPLTGLLNRAALTHRLDVALAGGSPVGVLVVAIAGFTAVNDVLGDELGDEALRLVGRRLAGAARDSDTVARLGGDQFAVLLPGLQADGAEHVGQRMSALLREPLALAGQVVPMHCRTGLALGGPGTEADRSGRAVLRAAEAAARTAPPGGACVLHDDARPDQHAERLRNEADLARALDADELFLLYQPLVSTKTGRVAAVEALVRWRHPERGLVPPNDFIGLAETTGQIVPLGMRVLELACAQLRQWAPVAPELTVAVNVSARQLVEPDFVAEVRRVLWSSGIDPSRMVLELTESLLVEDSDAAVQVLWQLRGLGVRLALDDFGTGYSSLGRLGDLPLDELKIDKSFVDRLGVEPRDSSALLKAAVAMGHGLGLEVVAEGVETTRQAQFLRSIECDLLQGYLLGKPLPTEELTSLLGQQLLPAGQTIPAPRSEDEIESKPYVPGLLPSLAPDRRR